MGKGCSPISQYSSHRGRRWSGFSLWGGIFVGLVFSGFGFVSPSVFRLGFHPPSQHTQVQFLVYPVHMHSTRGVLDESPV